MTIVEAYFKHEHADAPMRLSTPEDVDALVDAMLREPYENSVAALYVEGRLNAARVPDHELLLAVNQQDKVGGLRYMGGDGTYYATGKRSAYEQVVYFYTGSQREFPRDSELPLDVVRRVVKEFLAWGGERPGGIEWVAA
ncbi:MAG: Imm1 family immunity protein [Micromonosporaceae bacterium]